MSKRERKPVARYDPADYPTDEEEGEDLDDFLEEDNAEESEEEDSDLDGFIVSDDEDTPRDVILALARKIMTRPRLGFATAADEAEYFRQLAEVDDEDECSTDEDAMSEEEDDDYYYDEDEEEDDDYEPDDDVEYPADNDETTPEA